MSIEFDGKPYTKMPSMVSSHTVLLEEVSVHFQRILKRPRTLKEYLIRQTRKDLDTSYLKALDGITLQVNRGELFGLIGRNGAGKSTVMRVVSGILRPTSGRVRVWGETSPLLGVGSGFHLELTGRENIFLYSSMLGRRRSETEELFNQIVDFSELEDFIDTPMRMYSSGMIARLGFAVAMAKKPEILLVDEVLRVGDEHFREKCTERFQELHETGTTVILVTHSLPVVEELCTRAAWLENGRMEQIGNPGEVVEAFRKFRRKRGPVRSIRNHDGPRGRKPSIEPL
jgi:ABC-2 type transport system ATP-binding protein